MVTAANTGSETARDKLTSKPSHVSESSLFMNPYDCMYLYGSSFGRLKSAQLVSLELLIMTLVKGKGNCSAVKM